MFKLIAAGGSILYDGQLSLLGAYPQVIHNFFCQPAIGFGETFTAEGHSAAEFRQVEGVA